MLSLAAQQFQPYLKNILGTDYQIAANSLNGDGISIDQIATVIGTLYGLPPQTTAGVLKKVGATATEVGGVSPRPIRRRRIRPLASCLMRVSRSLRLPGLLTSPTERTPIKSPGTWLRI